MNENKFTLEEDFFLLNLVGIIGIKNWKIVSMHFNKIFHKNQKDSKICKKRWFEISEGNSLKKGWSILEDYIFHQCRNVLGNKWASMAKFLPGRSDSNIKNTYYSNLRKNTLKILENNQNTCLKDKLKKFYSLIHSRDKFIILKNFYNFNTKDLNVDEVKKVLPDYTEDPFLTNLIISSNGSIEIYDKHLALLSDDLNENNSDYNYSPTNSVTGEEVNYNNRIKNILNKLAINNCLKYSLNSDLFNSENFTYNHIHKKNKNLNYSNDDNTIEDNFFVDEPLVNNQISQNTLNKLINNFVQLYDNDDNNFKFYSKIEFNSFENLISSIFKLNKNSNSTNNIYTDNGNSKKNTTSNNPDNKNKLFEEAIIENFLGERKNSELNPNNSSNNYNKELAKLYHTEKNELLDKKRKR